MLQQIEEGYWQKNRASKVKDVKDIVEGIIEQVRKDGDKALIELTEKFDELGKQLNESLYEKLYFDLFENLFKALYVPEPEEEKFVPLI